MADTTDNTANTGISGMDIMQSDVFKRRLEEILAMPEGEEKERAKKLLSQDYAGLTDILGAELTDAEALLNTSMPEGRQAGQVYVAANPLEHLSASLRQGLGAYQGKQARDALRQLSADKGEATGDTMFAEEAQQPAPQQTQAQVPDLGQYGIQLGQNPQGAGMGQVTPRGAQVGNAVERRQNVREQGGTPPPVGQGVVGQAKLAAGLRGMGKPDLSGRGVQVANAGMGQLTDRLPQLKDMPSHKQQPLFGQPRPEELKNALKMIEPTPDGVQWQTPEELRREKEKLSRQRMLGGY
jgi:hypothetical protein